MTTLTVRGLEDQTRARLRVRAAQPGRSIEAEVQAILHEVLFPSPPEHGLATRIHARFAALGGAELELPAPATRRAPRTLTCNRSRHQCPVGTRP